MKPSNPPSTTSIDTLYQDIRQLIETAKAQVVTQVNQTLVFTYWQIGKTIKEQVITEQRAEYGDATMQKLADRLVLDYGSGFSRRNLFRMVKLYQYFSDLPIVTTLSAQLSWSHFVEIIKIEDELKREFYIRMCADARWSVRALRERIDNMLFERTAISKQRRGSRGVDGFGARQYPRGRILAQVASQRSPASQIAQGNAGG